MRPRGKIGIGEVKRTSRADKQLQHSGWIQN
uniref:Uncharacterized protein n=1 Tax=Trichinella nativa TaxID=6335 RepID=A0A0V1KIU3_9BILA